MKQPLLMVEGQLESAEDRQIEIQRLNVGTQVPIINVTGQAVVITRSSHHLQSSGGYKIVRNIFGGDNGDVLFLTGFRVRLRRGGNISKNIRLHTDSITMLIKVGGVWLPVQ